MGIIRFCSLGLTALSLIYPSFINKELINSPNSVLNNKLIYYGIPNIFFSLTMLAGCWKISFPFYLSNPFISYVGVTLLDNVLQGKKN